METVVGGWEDSIPEVSSPSWWHSGFPPALEMESLGTEPCPWEAASLVTLLIIYPTFLSLPRSVVNQLEAHSVPGRAISLIRDSRAQKTPPCQLSPPEGSRAQVGKWQHWVH